MSSPQTKLGKAITILLWLAAVGLLVENLVLARQIRLLRDAAASQITAGTQLHMLSGLALDGHVQPLTLLGAGSKLLIITFSPGCPACQANQEGWTKLANAVEQKAFACCGLAATRSMLPETIA